jgi:superfamily II DNA or RNA helicase
MPRIFDNIDQQLLPALCETLKVSERADFCVGYFNLRGWRQLDSYIEKWSGEDDGCCRLLVGMHSLPQDELREAIGLLKTEDELDNRTALKLKKQLAEEFRRQITFGAPNNEDEAGLRRLAAQVRAKKVRVKLYLRQLHAKLYLLYRPDPINPIVGYLGSSNLTMAGLERQGELNIDVLDGDTGIKLQKWFNDRWNERWCIDISDELVRVIDESWAREALIPPYHIYIKMAYHLSQEVQAGLREFQLPSVFADRLFPFQVAAVKLAARHINKRGGVLIGDVVGLGKTLMATAVARIFEDDFGYTTLIICPKNLVQMWEQYRRDYDLRGEVMSIGAVTRKLPNFKHYKLVVIDESHNLRNPDGQRYRAIRDYIHEHDSRVVLLTATPYNKAYVDLSSQLRLFVPEDRDLGIRPEQLLRKMGELEFAAKYQYPVRSILAFEKSTFADDWRELMRLYLVRRTRGFIKENYAGHDETRKRYYLTFSDGRRSYFPDRIPRTIRFDVNDADPNDQYARLYSQPVVDTITSLCLPRYGLRNYIDAPPPEKPTETEQDVIADLSKAGKRLMGFCRTGLFKRLESSGEAFLLSVRRHVLRNYVYLHALENSLPVPVGTQDVLLFDSRSYDDDVESTEVVGDIFEDEDTDIQARPESNALLSTKDYKTKAAQVYQVYSTQYRRRFKWLRSVLFNDKLPADLLSDINALRAVLAKSGEWNPDQDAKLKALRSLLAKKHSNEKVIVFTQFADTVDYLVGQLKTAGLAKLAGATGESNDPTALAWRFSPKSNDKQFRPEDELRVLIATDVLSEGQNLQDCYIVVNYDLPWAIIRLVQRAGRVDRIGQEADDILCYSFLPADGVERILRLRARVRQRLLENAEVVGADEAFFEDDRNDQTVVDLYHEKSGILDDDADTEVDLASRAYEIWNKAVRENPELKRVIEHLPNVVYSTRTHTPVEGKPEGTLVYVKTVDDNDALVWVDKTGKSVTESQLEVLKAAECRPDTPAIVRHELHHELVRKGVEHISHEERIAGGSLGPRTGAKYRTYERLKAHAASLVGTLYENPELGRVLEELVRYPLRQSAKDSLNRQLRSGINDLALAELVLALRSEGKLFIIHEERETDEPQIVCSMGLFRG